MGMNFLGAVRSRECRRVAAYARVFEPREFIEACLANAVGAVAALIGRVFERRVGHIGLTLTASRYEISRIFRLNAPAGATTVTSSPIRLPINARPMGDSFEIWPRRGSASDEPTRWYVSSSPSGATTLMCTPMRTKSAVVVDCSVNVDDDSKRSNAGVRDSRNCVRVLRAWYALFAAGF